MSANSRVGGGMLWLSDWLWAFWPWGWIGVVRPDDRAGCVRRRWHSGKQLHARGSVDAAMAQQRLNEADVGAVFQHVSGETVAERVDGDPLTDTGRPRRFAASRLQRFDVHVVACAPSREKPVFRRGVVGLSGGVLRAPPAA